MYRPSFTLMLSLVPFKCAVLADTLGVNCCYVMPRCCSQCGIAALARLRCCHCSSQLVHIESQIRVTLVQPVQHSLQKKT